MEYKDIQKVNSEIRTIDVKGKSYAEVPQRVNAFRKLYPEGSIETDIISLDDGVVVMKAVVSAYIDGEKRILGTGLAYEKESSSYINKTSYIENCETSAVGRALGFLGLGSDVSIASAEEVQNAIHNQERMKQKKEEEAELDAMIAKQDEEHKQNQQRLDAVQDRSALLKEVEQLRKVLKMTKEELAAEFGCSKDTPMERWAFIRDELKRRMA